MSTSGDISETSTGRKPDRGATVDLLTQRWVRATGREVTWREHPWLAAPVGDVEVIGTEFFHRFAARNGLEVVDDGVPRGLLESFTYLAGPDFDPDLVDPAVATFYETTSEYDFDVWSEWSGLYRPFGRLLAALFSRRLEQLNVPLSPLDTRLGVRSRVLKVRDPKEGRALYAAWVRDSVASGKTVYAGSYSWCRIPGFSGPCVKVAFPLPNGYALVVMRPESHADGSFTLHSDGKKFGDPGFYFYVESAPGCGRARYVPSLKESIHLFRGERSVLRADHELRMWGITFLRLHYRMQRASVVS